MTNDEMLERNRRMTEDRKSGMTLGELSKKYGITRERARQITSGVDEIRGGYNDPLWIALKNVADSLGGYSNNIVTRARNVVKRGYDIEVDGVMTHVKFQDIPRENWHKLPNCGERTLKLISAAFRDDE